MITHVYTENKPGDGSEIDFDVEKVKHSYVKWYDYILLNRPLKVVCALVLTGIVGPLLIYHFLFFANRDVPPSDGFSVGSCLLPRDSRLPCGYGHVNETGCHAQCCFDPGSNFCFHRLPSRFTYITDQAWHEDVVLHPRVSTVPYGARPSKTHLKLSIDEHSPTHLTLTFYDSRDIPLKGKRNDNKAYTYAVTSPELNVVINSTQGTIFNTARGPLIASDDIWEISFQLTNETMYGLGELPLSLGATKVLYNHNEGLNSIPLIYAKVNTSYHGVLIDTTSPTEVSVRGNNNIVVRSITRAGLKLHVFVGPQPKDVMRDAMTVIGPKMKLEYWMLGAHICSETTETLGDGYEDLRNFITNATREQLPFESHCGTAPIVFNGNKCNDDETEYIQKGIDLLKQAGKRFIPHLSPYIRFNKNITENEDTDNITRSDEDCYKIIKDYENLFYRHPTSLKLYQGVVGDDKVLYPSYDYASIDFMKAFWLYNVNPDGVILENSWPLDQSNKTHDNTFQELPYFSQRIAEAFDETPPWNLKFNNSEQKYLQNHNKYGNEFANAFKKIIDQTDYDIPAWSSSQWMNGDLAVNRQNINTSWTNLHQEIVEAALGGISGNWLWSSPVCGDLETFDHNRQANLCVKWYMASTFFPMLKVHSRVISRDPLAFIGIHRHLILEALKRRLSFLPYLYTTLQNGPVLRPMFYQFPSSVNLTNINTQFGVGDDLVIVPNTQPFQRFVHFWLPPGTWYELWSGLKLEGEEGQPITMSTEEADFFTVIRGGSILAMQKDTRETTAATRLLSAMSLTIALECEDVGSQCLADGFLYVEDNTSVNFHATENKLTISVNGYSALFCDPNTAVLASIIKEINVFGLRSELNNFDNHKNIQMSISLCNLDSNNEFPLN